MYRLLLEAAAGAATADTTGAFAARLCPPGTHNTVNDARKTLVLRKEVMDQSFH
jgi:hypothetical protein